ncbi:hypothetical protein WT60_09015 [Burkholderia sp. MSMB617WGS]|uniref:DMT family transporter n=1 Tax=Burkholderia sp. MSMB617WGS TaxID=1637831 RepID=UPI0008570773|nr:multidrug efflux SMR transporter [Burkholderia sp. MSMB617WGS]AOK46969.1 hypothetical protein WT60_09015 [Burkholderia sp. MSMB617WGS]
MCGTIFLKLSAGLARLPFTMAMGACYAAAIWLMGLATKQLEIGIAYAVWAGAGTALVGIAIVDEGASLAKWSGMTFIVAGVVLLNLSQKVPSRRRLEAARRAAASAETADRSARCGAPGAGCASVKERCRAEGKMRANPRRAAGARRPLTHGSDSWKIH